MHAEYPGKLSSKYRALTFNPTYIALLNGHIDTEEELVGT